MVRVKIQIFTLSESAYYLCNYERSIYSIKFWIFIL